VQPRYEPPGHLLQITPLERQALQLLADGDTPSEMSIGLGISATETDALLTRLFAASRQSITCANRRLLRRSHARGVLTVQRVSLDRSTSSKSP
jgi:hypothetical protein